MKRAAKHIMSGVLRQPPTVHGLPEPQPLTYDNADTACKLFLTGMQEMSDILRTHSQQPHTGRTHPHDFQGKTI